MGNRCSTAWSASIRSQLAGRSSTPVSSGMKLLRSAPVQNAFPVPVTTATQADESSRNRVQAPRRSLKWSMSSELWASGRLIVMVTTWPSCS
jgi:hypothetical protein